MRGETTRPSLWRVAGTGRMRETKNRTLTTAIAELREHICQGPELVFNYMQSRFLRKSAARACREACMPGGPG